MNTHTFTEWAVMMRQYGSKDTYIIAMKSKDECMRYMYGNNYTDSSDMPIPLYYFNRITGDVYEN